MISRFGSLFLGAALLFSVFLPFTRGAWDWLDIKVFVFLNSFVKYDTFGTLVALLNSRLGDWISHLSFSAILWSSITNRKEALYSLISLFAIVILTQALVNKGLFMQGLHFERASPSLQTEHFINLAKTHPFPNNRTTSIHSFPADHATTVFLCAAWILIATRGRGWKIPVILALFFSSPRLFAGGHGISDIIAGAGGITLLLFPLLEKCQYVLKQIEKKVS
jgi:membrane-associated phospholipid phosphatase